VSCPAPVFRKGGALACLLMLFGYYGYLVILRMLARWITGLQCQVKQLEFRISRCAQGNSDASIDLDFDLDQWLASKPLIASAIVWRDQASARPYATWTSSEKEQLRSVFWQIRVGDEPGLPDAPPATTTLLTSGEIFATNLDAALAWQYFLGYVAQSLAVEQAGWVPWSLAAYSPAELALLLDSRSLFEWAAGPQKYGVLKDHGGLFRHGSATPGDPARTHRFLRTHGLVAPTPRATIERVLDWCRGHLVHFYGLLTPANCQGHWQYAAYPPVERILSGTTHPQHGFGHWTAGCWGTTGFLRAVLRTVNVPASLERPCIDHAMLAFVHAALYLSHGDDPYDAWWRAEPMAPIGKLLIDQPKFDAWFGPTVNDPCANVGRQSSKLAVEYLPYALLELYCADLKANKTHANGSVFAALQKHYTLAELDAEDIWLRMDAKIQTLGGCQNIP
jgi:hypothetical protein